MDFSMFQDVEGVGDFSRDLSSSSLFWSSSGISSILSNTQFEVCFTLVARTSNSVSLLNLALTESNTSKEAEDDDEAMSVFLAKSSEKAESDLASISDSLLKLSLSLSFEDRSSDFSLCITPRMRSDVVEKSVAFDDDDADLPIEEVGVSKKTHISLSPNTLSLVSVSATLTSSQQISIEGSSFCMSPAVVAAVMLLQHATPLEESVSILSKSFHSKDTDDEGDVSSEEMKSRPSTSSMVTQDL